jgi:hypothetical protein
MATTERIKPEEWTILGKQSTKLGGSAGRELGGAEPGQYQISQISQ